MNASPRSDQQLLDEVIAALHEVRARAPQDFLWVLAVVLGTIVAIVFLLAIAVQDVFLQNLLLNLAIELLGAWLTVILIDGLWRRVQKGSLTEYDVMAQKLQGRKATPLSDQEREAWEFFIQYYQEISAEMQSRNPLRQVRVMLFAWNKRKTLESRGNRALIEFEREVKLEIEEERREIPTNSDGERDELLLLRTEVVELRKMMEHLVTLQTAQKSIAT